MFKFSLLYMKMGQDGAAVFRAGQWSAGRNEFVREPEPGLVAGKFSITLISGKRNRRIGRHHILSGGRSTFIPNSGDDAIPSW